MIRFLSPLLLAALASLPSEVSGQMPSLRREVSAGHSSASIGQLNFGRFLPGGGIVLADLDNSRLVRFGPDGRSLPSIGRKGQGPGELQAIGGIAVFEGGEVAVADVGKSALVRWAADGRPLPEIRIRPFMLATHRLGNELLIKSHDWRTDTLRLYRFAPDAGATTSPTTSFMAPSHPGAAGRVTTPMAAWTITPAGRILVGHPDSLYVVSELSSTGSLLRQWARPGYPTARWTEEELDRIEGFAAMASREGGGSRPSRIDFKHRNTVPQEALGIDARGRLWVLPYITGGMARKVDVFADNGHLLGTLSLEGNPTGIWVEGNRLLAWGTTTDDEPAVWTYRIVG